MREEGINQLVTPELSLVLGPPLLHPAPVGEPEPVVEGPVDADPELYGSVPPSLPRYTRPVKTRT